MHILKCFLDASYLLLREIDHVGREQRLAVLLEVCLVGIQHTICPSYQYRSVLCLGSEAYRATGEASCRIVSHVPISIELFLLTWRSGLCGGRLGSIRGAGVSG